MHINPTVQDRMPWRFTFPVLLLLAVLLFVLPAGAQTEVSGLTEDELLHQIHRGAYREEFFRRLADYTPEERAAAMEKFEDSFRRRPFPQAYNGDELLDIVLNSDDANQVSKAVRELGDRYEDASPEEHAALADLLRAEYRATPYPILQPDMSNTSEFNANHSVYGKIGRAARNLLPEKLALDLFRDIYLDSAQKGNITHFLLQIKGESFTGPATLAVLEELAAQVADYDEHKLNELGEHESLHGILQNRLRRFSDNSFEAIKARDWQSDSRDIYAMGRFEDPEARELLLEYYGTIPKEYRYCKRRLKVLSALIQHWKRNPDLELRNLLRDDLTEILNMDHNQNPYTFGTTAEVIKKTRDPYFTPLLKRRRAGLDLATIRRISTLPEEQLEATINGVLNRLDTAIKTLDAERVE